MATNFFEITHLGNDGCDTTCTESRRPSADELCEPFEELALGNCRVEAEKVGEKTDDSQELIGRVAAAIVRQCTISLWLSLRDTFQSTRGRPYQRRKAFQPCTCSVRRTRRPRQSSRT
jgi:hypothetical protein